MSSLWISKLKIAIIDKNLQDITILAKQMPSIEDSEIKVAMALTKEAIEMLQDKKNEISLSLNKLKKIQNYTYTNLNLIN